MERNFIEQDNVSHKYRLGFQVYILGNAYAAGIDLRHAATAPDEGSGCFY